MQGGKSYNSKTVKLNGIEIIKEKEAIFLSARLQFMSVIVIAEQITMK